MYRKGEINLPEEITKEQLTKALAILVEKGQLDPALLHAEVAQILTKITAEQHHKAALVMREAQESETAEQAKRQTEADLNANFELTPEQKTKLISTLQTRFKNNQGRHKLFLWSRVEAKLNTAPAKKLWSLWQMEETGGEPDIVDYDHKTGEYIFFDCSPESPTGRRNLVYDQAAEDWIKGEKDPQKIYNAIDLAAKMGINILDKDQYLYLQKLGRFDQNSWSWLYTPSNKKDEDVALNGHRNDRGVRIFENSSYYCHDDKAFRGSLRV